MSFNILVEDDVPTVSTKTPMKLQRQVLGEVQVNTPNPGTATKKTPKRTSQAFFIAKTPTVNRIPVKGDATPKDQVLLRGFQAPTFVDFGELTLDSGKKTIKLSLLNDSGTKLTVSKSNIDPTDDGFDIVFTSRRRTTTVAANSEQDCSVTFEPKAFGSFRAQLVLKLSSRHRCTVIVAGIVADHNLLNKKPNNRRAAAKKAPKQKMGSSKPSGAFRRVPVNQPKPIPKTSQQPPVGTASTTSTLQKAVVIKPRTRSPTSKANNKTGAVINAVRGKQLYDEKWDDKQQDGFTTWMNHVLCTNNPLVKGDAACSDAPATAKEDEHIFSTLATKKSEAAIRKRALTFFHSPEVRSVKEKLEQHIARGTLKVRSDKHIGRDVGLKKTLKEILFSYVIYFSIDNATGSIMLE